MHLVENKLNLVKEDTARSPFSSRPCLQTTVPPTFSLEASTAISFLNIFPEVVYTYS